MRAIIGEHSDYRVLKFDIAKREKADVVAELQARCCSIAGSETELRERLLRRLLLQVPALADKVPWYAIDEARVEEQMLIQLAEPQQSDASGAPASAAIETPHQLQPCSGVCTARLRRARRCTDWIAVLYVALKCTRVRGMRMCMPTKMVCER